MIFFSFVGSFKNIDLIVSGKAVQNVRMFVPMTQNELVAMNSQQTVLQQPELQPTETLHNLQDFELDFDGNISEFVTLGEELEQDVTAGDEFFNDIVGTGEATVTEDETSDSAKASPRTRT